MFITAFKVRTEYDNWMLPERTGSGVTAVCCQPYWVQSYGSAALLTETCLQRMSVVATSQELVPRDSIKRHNQIKDEPSILLQYNASHVTERCGRVHPVWYSAYPGLRSRPETYYTD
jgi:hypothetical protein